MTERRHPGIRWRILYGAYSGVEEFAVNELQTALQRRVPYVVEVTRAEHAPAPAGAHLILVGTAHGNPSLSDLARRAVVAPPANPGAYALAALDSPWDKANRLMVIAGADPAGVLHGVEDFNARVLSTVSGLTCPGFRRDLESISDFAVSESPAVGLRGIWTWGYVIYDYRRFLDNMARLRMNSIIIWNDCPPINCPEVIDCARARGISVILGFHWGWGTNLDITKGDDRLAIRQDVLSKYRRDYAGLDIDGIYFQTLTEHYDTKLHGRTTASWACQLANEITAPLLESNPDLRIYFGLHATSVLENFRDLAVLSPTVTIVWEDAGAVPFSYDPLLEIPSPPEGAEALPRTTEETLVYSKQLASLRPGGLFAMVPKGWINLDWRGEFEHHKAFVLGERGGDFVNARLASKKPRWDYVNSLWLSAYPAAARFYREMLDVTGGKLAVWGLVEDGCFEGKIQPSVSLFAQTLWNPRRTDADILLSAMNPYYDCS